MASFTLNAAGVYPDGTSVSVYPESNWPAGVNEAAAPIGAQATSGTVASGTVTFTGLTQDGRYVAYASINSAPVYRGFTAGSDVSNSSNPRARELGYVQATSNFATTNTALTDVASMTLTISFATAVTVMVRFKADGIISSAAAGGSLYLDEDGVDVGALTTTLGTTLVGACIGERRRSVAAGSHTWKIRSKQASAGTLTIYAGAGTAAANGPMFLQVTQVVS